LTVSLAVCLVHGAFAQYQFEPAGKHLHGIVKYKLVADMCEKENYKSRKMPQSVFYFLVQFYFTEKYNAPSSQESVFVWLFFCMGV
jgi:hypothetical protein